MTAIVGGTDAVSLSSYNKQIASPFPSVDVSIAGDRWLKIRQIEPLELEFSAAGENINVNAANGTTMMKNVISCRISSGKTLKPYCHLTLQFQWRQFTSGVSTNLHAIGAIGNAANLRDITAIEIFVLTGQLRSAGTYHVQMAQTSLFPLLLSNCNSSRHFILNKAVHEANSLLQNATKCLTSACPAVLTDIQLVRVEHRGAVPTRTNRAKI
ncbi:hypothetical protein ACEPAG_1159 [Sanghuangporus baumii]